MQKEKVFPTAFRGFEKSAVLDYIYEQDKINGRKIEQLESELLSYKKKYSSIGGAVNEAPKSEFGGRNVEEHLNKLENLCRTLNDENKRLMAELASLKNRNVPVFDEGYDKIEALTEENNQLKGRISELSDSATAAGAEDDEKSELLKCALVELKKKNAECEELKARLSDNESALTVHTSEDVNIDGFCKEIEDLKEENERLKKDLMDSVGKDGSGCDRLAEENAELKQKIRDMGDIVCEYEDINEQRYNLKKENRNLKEKLENCSGGESMQEIERIKRQYEEKEAGYIEEIEDLKAKCLNGNESNSAIDSTSNVENELSETTRLLDDQYKLNKDLKKIVVLLKNEVEELREKVNALDIESKNNFIADFAGEEENE